MKRVYFAWIAALLSLTSFAHENFRRVCGQDELVQYFRQIVPGYDDYVNSLFEEAYSLENEASRIAGPEDTIYTVRVVIHMVYLANDSLQNIPDDIVQSQIQALNRDYGTFNADTINLRPIFHRFRGYPKIQFELATTDPDGNPTTGIDRVAGKSPSIPPQTALDSLVGAVDDWFKKGFTVTNKNGNLDTTIGAPSWDNKRYLNIWVTNLNLFRDVSQGTLGGFAFAPPGLPNWPLGIGYPSNEADGVSIDFRFFGVNNYFAQARPDVADVIGQGRTTVHEVGHYLGLRHTWGDYGNLLGGDCSNPLIAQLVFNDGINDTPVERSPYVNTIGEYRCDTFVNTCNALYNGVDYPDLFENYMDYSGDQCYNMFTKQQVNFIRNVLRTRRAGIIVNKSFSFPTGLKPQNSANNAFEIFPNPASDRLTISSTLKSGKDVQVDVLDMTGRVLKSSLLTTGQQQLTLDISGLDKAMYIIRFSNDDFVTSELLIKQ